MQKFIEIDGSIGGGQLLRTALGLSVITKKPFVIKNIRAIRDKPGLREQHLQAVKSIKELCNAQVSGAKIDSKELKFKPGEITKESLNIKIETAGSTALVLQTLFLASFRNNLTINIKGGGTFNKFAPSIIYLNKIFIPILSKINFNFGIDVVKDGFYPKGGAYTKSRIKKSDPKYLDLIERGNLKEVNINSIASNSLKQNNVANRQADAAYKTLNKYNPRVYTKYVVSDSPGSGILTIANYDNTLIGFDVVGEKGKPSEIIGKESAQGLIGIMKSKATLDNFMIDQILPFLALGKGGRFRFYKLTEHVRTNIEIINEFLDVKFKIYDDILEVEN